MSSSFVFFLSFRVYIRHRNKSMRSFYRFAIFNGRKEGTCPQCRVISKSHSFSLFKKRSRFLIFPSGECESIELIGVVGMTTFLAYIYIYILLLLILHELFLLLEAIERFSSSFANYPLIAG